MLFFVKIHRSLCNVECQFMTSQPMSCKISYYRFGLSDLTMNPAVNGLSTLLETNRTFTGELSSQESLTVIGIFSILSVFSYADR